MNSLVNDYVGKTVLLNVMEEFRDSNAALLQSNPKSMLIYCRLDAVDHTGLWVENPNWKTVDAKSGVAAVHKMLVLIPWHGLVSIALFPEREFEGDVLPNEKAAYPIGFIWNESQKDSESDI